MRQAKNVSSRRPLMFAWLVTTPFILLRLTRMHKFCILFASAGPVHALKHLVVGACGKPPTINTTRSGPHKACCFSCLPSSLSPYVSCRVDTHTCVIYAQSTIHPTYSTQERHAAFCGLICTSVMCAQKHARALNRLHIVKFYAEKWTH
jgi:hypothetical protein